MAGLLPRAAAGAAVATLLAFATAVPAHAQLRDRHRHDSRQHERQQVHHQQAHQPAQEHQHQLPRHQVANLTAWQLPNRDLFVRARVKDYPGKVVYLQKRTSKTQWHTIATRHTYRNGGWFAFTVDPQRHRSYRLAIPADHHHRPTAEWIGTIA